MSVTTINWVVGAVFSNGELSLRKVSYDGDVPDTFYHTDREKSALTFRFSLDTMEFFNYTMKRDFTKDEEFSVIDAMNSRNMIDFDQWKALIREVRK